MNAILALSSKCRPAAPSNAVLNSECCYTFHSPFTSEKGIVVNLETYIGSVEELAFCDSNNSNQEGLFVRIVKQRVPKANSNDNMETDQAAAPPTKLGVGVEGGFAGEDDKWEIITKYSLVVLKPNGSGVPPTVVTEMPYEEATKETTFKPEIVKLVDSVILHAGMTTQQDVKAWQLDTDEETKVSKYYKDLPFVDNGVMISPNPKDWKCQKSGDTKYLWLNLSDGFIVGGRRNWDGSGGSNGALDHYNETGQQYPLVVKLGTITADLDSADCFSYAKDEDGPVKIPNLGELLEKRGIKVANMQKTVKSTAELEVELNHNFDFNAITSAGTTLAPASGPSLQGLQNLGNSCYMNSVLQMLFSTPELAHRYGTSPGGSVTYHPIIKTVPPKEAPTNLLCQTTKVACALTSGVFAKPLADEKEEKNNGGTDPKYRLAPRMFKYVVGKDHVDFRTGQQQDAAQFLQYMLEKVDRAELANDIAKADPLHVTSHLFSFKTTDRLVCTGDGSVKYKESSAPETIWSLPIPMEKAVVREAGESPDVKRHKPEGESKGQEEEQKPIPTVAFQDVLESWGGETTVEGIRWPHLQNAVHGATQTTRLSNFPRYLVIQMQRYQLGPDWQPMKLEIKLDIPDKIDLNNLKSTGPQEGEKLVPEEDENVAAAKPNAAPEISETALAQLMDMGFHINGCKRALTAVGGSDVEAAMNWVFEHNMDPDFNDPLPEPGAGAAAAPANNGDSGVDEGVVTTLVESLGCFTPDQVRAALKATSGAADRAADWLFSHMDDLDEAIAALSTSDSGSAPIAAPKVPLEDGSGEYTLVGTVSHIGKHTGSGHYVAHMKRGDKWVIFNDEKVAYCESPPSEHAYMYLFQRNDTFGSPNPNY